jgi:hypothetical protein
MDIIQLFGPASVPAVVFGSVLGVFELGDRLASQQRVKDPLSKWLVSFDVQKAKALPEGTQELFERIFGERHFSLKCFVRSAAFSLCAIVFVRIIVLLINPSLFFALLRASPVPVSFLYLPAWIVWAILIDYVSLFKARVILRILTRFVRLQILLSLGILIIDYVTYKVLFRIGLVVMF